MSRTPDNSADILDSRDIESRVEELRDERETLATEAEDARENLDDLNADADEDERDEAESALAAARKALADWDDDYGEELRALESFAEELRGYGDWDHGETLIRESYFTDYARQLAEDIGAIDPRAGWPLNCIDWDAAAEELKADYTSGEFDGVTYYMRA